MSGPGRPRPLVIGVGNRDRGDDAIGPLVADAAQRRYGTSMDCRVLEGDLSDLALRWHADQTVVIIDAMVSGREPGAIVQIDAAHEQFQTQDHLLSSHGVGLREAIELARMLDRLPASLTVIGVEAVAFEHFAPVSDAAAAAIKEVVRRLPEVVQLGDLGPCCHVPPEQRLD